MTTDAEQNIDVCSSYYYYSLLLIIARPTFIFVLLYKLSGGQNARAERDNNIFVHARQKNAQFVPMVSKTRNFWANTYLMRACVKKKAISSGESHSKARKFMGDYVIQKIAASIRAKG